MRFWNSLIENIKFLQNSYRHLKDIKINDHDKKRKIPVHVPVRGFRKGYSTQY